MPVTLDTIKAEAQRAKGIMIGMLTDAGMNAVPEIFAHAKTRAGGRQRSAVAEEAAWIIAQDLSDRYGLTVTQRGWVTRPFDGTDHLGTTIHTRVVRVLAEVARHTN